MSSSAFPRVQLFNGRLSVDKQTSVSWHQDAGTRTAQFTIKRRSGQTHILFKLKACSKTLEVCGRISYYFYYVNFGIVRCYGYDKIVFYAYYFIYIVFTVFWLKENEVIFGCIGLTDTVVCSNLSYSLFRALSV